MKVIIVFISIAIGLASFTINEKIDQNITVRILKKITVPKSLKEISGIAHINDNIFACVQDESGIVYIFDTDQSQIIKEIAFGPSGDYEDIAIVGNAIWVLQSNGKLFEIANYNSTTQSIKSYNTTLTTMQNVEGMCYDQKNNYLLLAIKDAEINNPNYKGVYAFDLTTKKMIDAPFIKINMSQGKGKKFMPSAIAIHPKSFEYYITDGRNKQLMILKMDGSVKHVYRLDQKEFLQPEGICFDKKGQLYISNEGGKGNGNIMLIDIAE